MGILSRLSLLSSVTFYDVDDNILTKPQIEARTWEVRNVPNVRRLANRYDASQTAQTSAVHSKSFDSTNHRELSNSTVKTEEENRG